MRPLDVLRRHKIGLLGSSLTPTENASADDIEFWELLDPSIKAIRGAHLEHASTQRSTAFTDQRLVSAASGTGRHPT